ncbi:MAG: DUF4157 domain-containing protein [Myxococcales bacterium]|nr:DUF4157 domain-containing protein [Myxococcales bacterium]
MADQDDPTAERQEEEERRKRLTLDEDIARRYDASRLQKMVIQGAGRGERLDLATRSDMERRIPGHDFSNVRVFRGALAEEITARHGADAVTIANTGMILVRESARSSPGTTSGQALLAHELTHVAQAQRGMHFALAHGGGDGAHEHEAEAVEQSVAGGHGAATGQSGAQNVKAKEAGQRKKVIERVVELLEDDDRLRRQREGNG